MSLINTDNIPYRKVVVPEYDVPIKMVSEAVINALPTVEPKKGHWKKFDIAFEDYVCSECNYGIWAFRKDEFKFCPACGADMRGDKNDKEHNNITE